MVDEESCGFLPATTLCCVDSRFTFAGLLRAWHEALDAGARVSANHVRAGAVAARVAQGALILV